jgi:hypothetical protein
MVNMIRKFCEDLTRQFVDQSEIYFCWPHQFFEMSFG